MAETQNEATTQTNIRDRDMVVWGLAVLAFNSLALAYAIFTMTYACLPYQISRRGKAADAVRRHVFACLMGLQGTCQAILIGSTLHKVYKMLGLFYDSQMDEALKESMRQAWSANFVAATLVASCAFAGIFCRTMILPDLVSYQLFRAYFRNGLYDPFFLMSWAIILLTVACFLVAPVAVPALWSSTSWATSMRAICITCGFIETLYVVGLALYAHATYTLLRRLWAKRVFFSEDEEDFWPLNKYWWLRGRP